jgi:uncharacterized protein YyaL (SSP411 family)
MSATAQSTNRLALETSPYLLQHADNPVDWYPWGEEALALARRENKPILLSIGYSACHWCHVMAHESFADPATATLMNQLFVNVKVDREERPDLDKVYQLAHEMLTGRRGGWPLTMFLAPEGAYPFFGGTYFPREARQGMPAFSGLLQRVAEFYRTRSEDIHQQRQALIAAFAQLTPPAASPTTQLDATPLTTAREQLANRFDAENGGFGEAPKFPQAPSLALLLRLWRMTAASDTPDLHSLYMATLSLTRMAEGGIYDHIGGGFFRYSTDAAWQIPHFEKMLYDNGQLLELYSRAAIATGEPLFARVAADTAAWLLREMRAPQGGFWSALDADTEGEEGQYYLWSAAATRPLLGGSEFELLVRRFGLDAAPNFEGHWHLRVALSMEDIASESGLEPEVVEQAIDSARAKLLTARNTRVRPGRDEKILTAWNGLAITGLTWAGRALASPHLTEAAVRAVDFLQTHAWQEGRLTAVHTAGRARFAGYLDDYAFLLAAVLEVLQSTWRSEHLQFAVGLADALLEHFYDREAGGFFFTADDHETLILRSKNFSDEAVPAGGGIATQALARLGVLLGEPRYLNAAAHSLAAAWPALEHYPQAHASLLGALDEHLHGIAVIVIRGPLAEASRWRDAVLRTYDPRRIAFAIPDTATALPPSLASKRSPLEAGATVAYVCQGTSCSAPVTTLAALLALA